jgi:hypothetical protein
MRESGEWVLKKGQRETHACGRGGERLLARAAAHGDEHKTTRRGDGTAPQLKGTRGKDSGEVSGSGVFGRLGERTSTERTPGVRRIVIHQSTVDRGQTKQDKVDGLLRKA